MTKKATCSQTFVINGTELKCVSDAGHGGGCVLEAGDHVIRQKACYMRRWECSTSYGPLMITCPFPLLDEGDREDVLAFIDLFRRQISRCGLDKEDAAIEEIVEAIFAEGESVTTE